MLEKSQFRKKMEDYLHSRLTLDHPILLELAKPQKNLPLIKKIALQGYQLTKAFTGYIGLLYYNCPLAEFRMRLSVNLYEEETGKLSKTANHMDLMHRFMFALGIEREELDAEQPLPSTLDLVEYRQRLCEDPHRLHMGAAAVMIASEGQNLEKKAGKSRDQMLPTLYGLTAKDLEFFSVHAVEDVYHVGDGLDLVSEICNTAQMQDEAMDAIKQTCDRFWRFYDGIQHAYEVKHNHRLGEPVQDLEAAQV
jgi:pyrroloquinoline-quinone synthase